MPLNDQDKGVLDLIRKHAAEEKGLCLMECKRLSDGKMVPLLCLVVHTEDGIETYPVGQIFTQDENPMNLFEPPDGATVISSDDPQLEEGETVQKE